jgi:hypothetical protein
MMRSSAQIVASRDWKTSRIMSGEVRIAKAMARDVAGDTDKSV